MVWPLTNRQHESLFPDEPRNVAYEERTASGRSHKSWYSKLAGAQNCLALIVTDEELWISTRYQCAAVPGGADLEHRIALQNIDEIRVGSKGSPIFKSSLILRFTDTAGVGHVVEVMPGDVGRFTAALRKENQ